MQIHPRLRRHRRAHFSDQTLDISRRRLAGIHDEVGMFLRHLCAADALAFQPAAFDQLCRMPARRVAEHRARIGQLQRLARAALFHQRLDLLSRRLDIALLEMQPGTDEELFARRMPCHMAISDLVFLRRALQQLAASRQHLHARHLLPGFAAVAPRVHRQHAAQRAGDAREKFRAAQVVRGSEARQFCARHSRLRVDDILAIHAQLAQRAVHQQHCAAQAAVAHQQIAAQPNRIQRLLRRHLPQKVLQIREVCRTVQALRRSTCAPTRMAAHGNIEAQFAP